MLKYMHRVFCTAKLLSTVQVIWLLQGDQGLLSPRRDQTSNKKFSLYHTDIHIEDIVKPPCSVKLKS